jgi:uncharacterized protein (DUF4415 family)
MSEKKPKKMDADTAKLLASLKRGLAQASKGKFAAVHTPGTIVARRKPGRPVGATAAVRKQPITLRVDPEVLAGWRASGKGWQTRAAAALAAAMP